MTTPPELTLKGSTLLPTITDIQSRGGFIAGIKCGPRNADYTIRIHWGVNWASEFEKLRHGLEVATV